MTATTSPALNIPLEYLAPGNGDIQIIPSTGSGDQAIHEGNYQRCASYLYSEHWQE